LRELLNFLLSQRIVLLYSPSGDGKTSLVQAGLIPNLDTHTFLWWNMDDPQLSPAARDLSSTAASCISRACAWEIAIGRARWFLASSFRKIRGFADLPPHQVAGRSSSLHCFLNCPAARSFDRLWSQAR
jgi:hypothetical protein